LTTTTVRGLAAASARTFSVIAPHLTERHRRLLLDAAARHWLWRGRRVARLAEASRPTVRRGAAELDQPADPRGAHPQHEGPKRRRDTDPGLLVALDRLIDSDTRGDPKSPLRWTCRSTRELAEALTRQGHPVSEDTVGRLLGEQGYRLQRTVAGSGSPQASLRQSTSADFPDPTLGKAIPYGVCDLGRNTGWVGVGVDLDPALGEQLLDVAVGQAEA
jgi:hypothetical protein